MQRRGNLQLDVLSDFQTSFIFMLRNKFLIQIVIVTIKDPTHFKRVAVLRFCAVLYILC